MSEDLDEAIRDAADELRVPVSNLVRNVLEDIFEVVENVTDSVGDLVDGLPGDFDRARARARSGRRRGERRGPEEAEIETWEAEAEGRRAAPEPAAAPQAVPEAEAAPEVESGRASYPEVLGWQPLILNGAQSCADCDRPLRSGDRGFAGLLESGLAGIYLCSRCIELRR
ncbi:MAG: hypothetical protein VX614_01410 [Myxococcota bacterium]|nr:hypothetical protein [Myxococcota bacterium]